MSTTTAKHKQQIAESLGDKEYRDALTSENIKNHIAFQIQAMRASRGWSQSDLGKKTGILQEQISRLEDPDYGRYTIKTLLRLASAFDVTLSVAFAPFSDLVSKMAELSVDALDVPSYSQDVVLHAVLDPGTALTQGMIEASTVSSASIVNSGVESPYLAPATTGYLRIAVPAV